VKWVKVVDVEVVAARTAAADVGRAEWAAPSPPARAATACAPVVGTRHPTRQVCLATRRSVRNAGHR
jgi:hypothetical protein